MYPYVFRWDSFSQHILTGVDMGLHYDMMTGMTRMRRSPCWCQGTLQKLFKGFMKKSHLEISKSLTATTLRSWHKGQHFIHHISFPIQGLLDEVHFSRQKNVPCLRPSARKHMKTGSANLTRICQGTAPKTRCLTRPMVFETMDDKKGHFHCVNDLCKRFEGDPSLRLCLALVTPACLALNHLHVGCELKDGRWT